VNKFAIALLLGTVFAVGCGDKTDGAGSGSAKASGAPSGSAKATASAAAAAATNATAGNKTCDDYWTKQRACNEAQMKGTPEGAGRDAAKKVLDDAEKMTKDLWAKLEGPGLETACKAMLDSLAQNTHCPK